jgi:tetratricopeptide (TPR) repeat protein
MNQPTSRAIRGPRLGGLLLLLGLCAVAAVGVLLIVRGEFIRPAPTWAAIQRARSAGRWTEVEEKLERWIEAHPEKGEARLMLANIQLGRERKDSAIRVLRSVPEADAAWSKAQMMLGELSIRDRRAAEAEHIFRRVADRNPRALEPRQRLIYLMSLQQRTAEARDLLWQLYQIRDDPKILVDLVLELLLDQQDVRGLAPEIEQFVARSPEDPLLRRVWGISLLYEGRPAEALANLEAAANRLVNDPLGRFALAECRILNGMPVIAEEVLGPPPEKPDDAALWWLCRGRLEESIGLTERAVSSFQQAVELQPQRREAHFRLGKLLKRLGRPGPARLHMEQANRIDQQLKAVRREHQRLRGAGLPADAQLFEHLGQLCFDAGLVPESRAWYEQSIKLDPTREGIQTKLARLKTVPDSMPVSLAHPILSTNSVLEGRPSSTSVTSVAAAQIRHDSSTSSPSPLPFEDRAQEAGVVYAYDSGASDRHFMADTMGGGVGLIDYDNDGWIDIYFVNGCSIPFDINHPPRPNVLYRNQRDGTFRDATAQAGVGGRGYGMGCAVGDYDNDGDDDLFVTGLNQTILYRNRGDGTFEDVTSSAGVTSDRWTTAAGFGDLDGDGDLDLVVITYVQIRQDDAALCRDHSGRRIHCTPARYAAQSDLLYRNNGDGTFTEVSRAAGFVAPNGRGLGLAIADFDGDGKLDIFVANDASPNFLFRNLGGFQFEEIGETAGVAVNGSGRATASMGVVADDLDGDGRIDLFITNLVNESSTFFRNLGGGLFLDATLGAGLDAPSRPKTGFGTAAIDADNDGRLDLFVANGHVDHRPWANSPMAQTALFFWGRDRGRFDLAGRAGSAYFAQPFVGRGVAAGDLNNDGQVDLVVVHRDAPGALLFNRSRGGHWLGLRLRGTRAGRSPVGTQVTCHTNGRSMVRWLTSGTGYLSAHDPRIWFGLGIVGEVERIEVKWPSGRVQSWRNLTADRILEIEEGREELGGTAESKRMAPTGSR